TQQTSAAGAVDESVRATLKPAAFDTKSDATYAPPAQQPRRPAKTTVNLPALNAPQKSASSFEKNQANPQKSAKSESSKATLTQILPVLRDSSHSRD
ncbi:MAG: hypothetical protein K2Z81_18440, partial [Cyanobacteria bacterium]|nr:hypothetical protein [Cyanobacteriota bacterium]